MTSPWLEVGDRVFLRRYEFLDQSIGAILGSDSVAVIDTRSTHPQADELLRDLRSLSPLPIVGINTHHHWDHAFGNARLLPSAIWGMDRCAEVLRTDGEEMRRGVMEALPELAAELAEVVITPPDRTFARQADLDLGGRAVQLRHLGRGHTDNDIVVIVPAAGVLFAGDLLENDAPPSFGDSYPIAWAETVRESLLPILPDVVVAGHGRPAGRDFAARCSAELDALAELIRGAVAGSIGLDEVIARSPYPRETTNSALERGHRELEEEAGSV